MRSLTTAHSRRVRATGRRVGKLKNWWLTQVAGQGLHSLQREPYTLDHLSKDGVQDAEGYESEEFNVILEWADREEDDDPQQVALTTETRIPPRLTESTLDSSSCSDVCGNARRGFRSNSGPPAKSSCPGCTARTVRSSRRSSTRACL